MLGFPSFHGVLRNFGNGWSPTAATEMKRIHVYRRRPTYLIDDDNRVSRQVWIAGDLPQEEALGEEKDAGRSPPGRVEAHLRNNPATPPGQRKSVVPLEATLVHQATGRYT